MKIKRSEKILMELDSIAMSRSESDQDNYRILNMIQNGNPLVQFMNCESFREPPFSLCKDDSDRRRMMASILMMGTARNLEQFSAQSVARNIDLVMNLYKYMDEMDSSIIEEDIYLKKISLPMMYQDDFVFSFHTYRKDTLFHFGEPVEEKYRDILRLGYFRENVNYPYITKNGEYFASISAHDISEGKQLVSVLSGNVLITGLSIGYLAYLAHLKESVKQVTIVEEDEDVIDLFHDEILEQFDDLSKITVIHSNVDTFMNEWKDKYDCVLVSHYKDSMDGVFEYLNMKKIEKAHKKCKFVYLIEGSILSNIKSALLMMCMAESSDERNELYQKLFEDEESSRILNVLQPYFEDYSIENVKTLQKLFVNSELKKMFKK